MRTPVYPLLLAAIVALAWSAPVLAHPAHHAQRPHHPLRVHPHDAARALLRAERIDARLDRRAVRAAAHGRYRAAAALDRRGDRLVHRVERRLRWAHHAHAVHRPHG